MLKMIMEVVQFEYRLYFTVPVRLFSSRFCQQKSNRVRLRSGSAGSCIGSVLDVGQSRSSRSDLRFGTVWIDSVKPSQLSQHVRRFDAKAW
ncbi:hypothetical protein Hdeb2414_s0164g00819591 [Helianthus debilis subsp. tardiflorus]